MAGRGIDRFTTADWIDGTAIVPEASARNIGGRPMSEIKIGDRVRNAAGVEGMFCDEDEAGRAYIHWGNGVKTWVRKDGLVRSDEWVAPPEPEEFIPTPAPGVTVADSPVDLARLQAEGEAAEEDDETGDA